METKRLRELAGLNEDAQRQDNLQEFLKLEKAVKDMDAKQIKHLINLIIFTYVPENKHPKLIEDLKKKKLIK